MDTTPEMLPAGSPGSPGGPSFFANAQDFTIGTQYNVGQIITASTGNSNLGLLEILNPIPDASYTRNRRTSPPDSNCLPGTRQDLIRKVTTWVDSSVLLSKCHIMWLYGYVGCGKSAIAQAVAEKFAQKKRLAASFFFFRGSGDRSRTTRFAATIASQIASSIPATAKYIKGAVKTEVGLLGPNVSLSSQFRRLVLDPINAVKWDRLGINLLRGPYLIIIDGLDECEDREEVSLLIEEIVTFFNKNPRIPLRIFVTSRVEEHIRTRLEDNQVRLINLVNHTSPDDIMTALRAAFASAAKHSRSIQAYGEWPTPSDLTKLASLIGRSFIFMSTIIKFILGPSNDGLTPVKRLPLALNMNPGLDGLYTETLLRSQHLPHFFDITRTIALLQEPLSILELASLLDLESSEIIDVLMNLHAILQIPGDDTTPVTVCHSSLCDFFKTRTRSGRLFAEQSHHKRMAYSCIALLGRSDSDVPAFNYAESHWEYHWRQFAHPLRGDGTGLRDLETQNLISHLRAHFPPHFATAVATYILTNPEHLLGEGIVSDPATPRVPQGDNSVVVELLAPQVPTHHTRLIIKALNMLRFHRRWDDRKSLEGIWAAINPPLPPLVSFHATILSLSTRYLMKGMKPFSLKLSPHYNPSTTSLSGEQPNPVLFGLCFMSWVEHFALSIEHGPCPRFQEIIRLPNSPWETPVDGDPTMLLILHFLMKEDSMEVRDRFISSVRRAVAAFNVTNPRAHDHNDARRYMNHLESFWVWSSVDGTTGGGAPVSRVWVFGYEFKNTNIILEDVLAAFSVLAKCLEGTCGELHGDTCPIQRDPLRSTAGQDDQPDPVLGIECDL